jgi:predicted Zn-dependent protease
MADEKTTQAEGEGNDRPVARPAKPKPSARLTALAVVLVIVSFGIAGYRIHSSMTNLPFNPEAVRHDGSVLYIATFGNVGDDAVEVIRSNIQREFPELGSPRIINLLSNRGIINSRKGVTMATAEMLLAEMAREGGKYPDLLKMVGIIEVPLYSTEGGPDLDIWGLTDANGGNFAIVSTTMKRREIEAEGLKPGTKEYAAAFDLSLGKSTLHEFGHLMGLYHCNGDIGCPMEVSSSMKALEERGNVYCGKHREQLRELYELWGITPIK